MSSRTVIGAVAMAAALTTGAVVGAALGVPGISGAQDDPTTTTSSTPAEPGPGGSSNKGDKTDKAEGSGEADRGDEGGRPGRRHRGPHRGPGFGFGFGAGLDTAAEVLGMSVEDLRDALGDGSSLAEVATAQGVDRQELVDALVATATERLDEAKAALPERIGELVERTFPTRGEGDHRPGHRPDAPAGEGDDAPTPDGD